MRALLRICSVVCSLIYLRTYSSATSSKNIKPLVVWVSYDCKSYETVKPTKWKSTHNTYTYRFRLFSENKIYLFKSLLEVVLKQAKRLLLYTFYKDIKNNHGSIFNQPLSQFDQIRATPIASQTTCIFICLVAISIGKDEANGAK